ncbi:MAG: alpha-L-rhamnosidase N-terminal domain-containing protein, partial [Lachnospiraceae bacterium]|nr:alpha-L-rhamnosidase N-terminal domain-containing protein [Lachnospiraceae bacterium]
MKIYDFRIEYREQPKGLTVRIPRFSWKIASDEKNVVQASWRIVVDCGGNCVWDSGKVESDQSVLVPYCGTELEEEKEYRVSLQITDNHGNSAQAETDFTTGIFDSAHFRAKMITHNFPKEETACPVFFRRFELEKPVKSAYLYGTAHGVYEAYVNGEKAGDAYMAPGWTDYHKILQYQFYDVTEELRNHTGENLLELTVGNGWYKGILSFDCKPDRYGDRTAAWAELHVTYEDGTRDVIATDETWQVRTGQIRYSEIYNGETIDTNAPEIRDG